jgi:hypothetical protein
MISSDFLLLYFLFVVPDELAAEDFVSVSLVELFGGFSRGVPSSETGATFD